MKIVLAIVFIVLVRSALFLQEQALSFHISRLDGEARAYQCAQRIEAASFGLSNSLTAYAREQRPMYSERALQYTVNLKDLLSELRAMSPANRAKIEQLETVIDHENLLAAEILAPGNADVTAAQAKMEGEQDALFMLISDSYIAPARQSELVRLSQWQSLSFAFDLVSLAVLGFMLYRAKSG